MKIHQGFRLRRGRFSEPNRIYLITTVTQDRVPLFCNFWLGREVVRAMHHHHASEWVESLAFVVMPDHLHWLVQLEDTVSLSRLMQSFKAYTARRINHFFDTPGTRRWQHGFHDHALRSEEDLVQTARYVVANPLRAGLVKKLGDYPLWDAVWL